MSDHEPGTCGCCGDVAVDELTNRPGLPALRWRAGTHPTSFARMKASLPVTELPDGPNAGLRPLVELTTRSTEDFAIGLLDASAVTADILAFYSERIANEGYLRTATERRSVLEIARTIGYELRPGVAASAYVALAVDDPLQVPGALPQPTTVFIPAATKVQSVPGTRELPQTFETAAAIEARAEWNAMRPRLRLRQELGVWHRIPVVRDAAGRMVPVERIWLAGDVSSIKEGDRLVIDVSAANIDPSDPVSRTVPLGTAIVRVARVVVERPADPALPTYTRVELVSTFAASGPSVAPPVLAEGQPAATPLAMTADVVRTYIFEQSWTEEALRTFLTLQGWDPRALIAQLAALIAAAPSSAEVVRFQVRVGVFGHNAPLAAQVIAASDGSARVWANWDDPRSPTSAWTTSGSPGLPSTTRFEELRANLRAPERPLYSDLFGVDVFLERTIDAGVGGWALLEAPGAVPTTFRVRGTLDAALADFAISGKATGLALDAGDDFKRSDAGLAFRMRRTTVHAASEPMVLATAPILETVGRAGAGVSQLVLDRMTIGLARGRLLAITGETVDEHARPTGTVVSEIAVIEEIRHALGTTTLVLRTPLQHGYRRTAMAISANVVLATHGETISAEPLGSGDATRPFQWFVLKRPPVTWVSAAAPSGTATTIDVQIDGVSWAQRASLWDAEPEARAYTVRTDDDGRTAIAFGDGAHGARIPTGRDNVTATYRTGIGLAGEIGAGRLSIMPQKPLGLRGATNPLPAAGAEDPERIDAARRNAPLTVLTLDRVVSRRDYEDFARGFAGIGKALASELWSGQRRIVHVTIAAAAGGAVDPTGPLFKNLHDAIASASDPSQLFALGSHVSRLFELDAVLTVAPGAPRAEIEQAARAWLLTRFSFDARDLGQPATASEITAALQRVPGVIAVQLTRLFASHEAPMLRAAIPAPSATWDPATRTITPATLLAIQPLGIRLATQLEHGAVS